MGLALDLHGTRSQGMAALRFLRCLPATTWPKKTTGEPFHREFLILACASFQQPI